MIQWRLKKGHDRRLREGHPWVFSNELAMSPKGAPLGGAVELFDWEGKFLAFGYSNPHSLISARILSNSAKDKDCVSPDFIGARVLKAWKRRHQMGLSWSYRICFGEGDLVPGLILDRYVIRAGKTADRPGGVEGQLFAVQMTTAGIDRILAEPVEFFRKLSEEARQAGFHSFSWEQTAVVVRNDTGSRELEGLKREESKIVKAISDVDLAQAELAVTAIGGAEPLWLACDLVEGQKTGFFLDQIQNIHRVGEAFGRRRSLPKTVRILDLCSYVGHWSAQLGAYLKSKGVNVETDLVDVSATALERASENARRAGVETRAHKLDVFEKDFPVEPRSFDIVIADPPALIKSRKAIPQGQHGYLKINTKALQTVTAGGLFVTCSCSGLLSEEDFTESIRKAFRKSGRRAIQLFRGGHGTDHPQRPEFPEGTYLKMHVFEMEGS